MRFASIVPFFLTTTSVVTGFFVPLTDNRSSSTQLSAATLDGRKINGELKPLNNFLLVKKSEAQDETEGGILLTGKAKITKTEGIVTAVGPGRTHPDSGLVFEMPVEEGEGVVYGQFDGTELDISGDKFVLIRDDDILVKFTGELTLESVDTVRDSVLVYVEKKEQETEGGILIASTSKKENKPSTGEVIKAGPGKMASNGELMVMEVAPGDMIKFRDFAGNDVVIEGKEYTVVKMADILAKF